MNQDNELKEFLTNFFKDKLKSTLHFDKLQSKGMNGKKNPTTDNLLTKFQEDKYINLLKPENVKKYAFYPFIHYTITERRVSKIKEKKNGKKVSICNKIYKSGEEKEKNKIKKERPIHYASHKANLIYSYYAGILQKKI